ncbi:unnamed protein product, partial [Bubo scandiacus]
GLTLGLKLFNIFISDLDDEIKCTLMKSANYTKLSGELPLWWLQENKQWLIPSKGSVMQAVLSLEQYEVQTKKDRLDSFKFWTHYFPS